MLCLNMYQLLKLRGIGFYNMRGIGVPVSVTNSHNNKLTFCNKVLDIYYIQEKLIILRPFLRFSSTNVSPVFVSEDKKKKRFRKRKKYAELLEVSSDCTSEKKTTLKKLGANNIVEFSGVLEDIPSNDGAPVNDLVIEEAQGDCSKAKQLPTEEYMSLEEIEEIREEASAVRGDPEHTVLDVMSLSGPTAVGTSLLEEYADQVGTLSKKSEAANSEKPRFSITKNNKEKFLKVKSTELEKAGKEKSLNISLLTYLELCVKCGFLSRGISSLEYYLKWKKDSVINDIRIFNKLMEGYAGTGNVDKLVEVWKMMREAGVSPSASSFVFHIEAIARSKKHEKSALIHDVLRKLEAEGLEVNDLFYCQWKGDSREVVLSAVRVARPTFIPLIPPLDIFYSCDLLKHLNVVNTDNLKSPAENLFTEADIPALFEEQLKMEMNFFIDIKSIEKVENIAENVNYYRDRLESMKSQWERNILQALHRDLTAMNAIHKNLSKHLRQLNVYPYLMVLNKHDYKDIIMHEIRKLAEGSETFSPTVSQLYKEIGNQVRLRYEMKVKSDCGILEKAKHIYTEYCKWYLKPASRDCNNFRQKWQLLSHQQQNGPSLELECYPWPQTVLYGVGKFLYNIIMRGIKIDVNIFRPCQTDSHYLPAFYSVFRHQGHLTKEEIKPHPVLSRLFRAAAVQQLSFNVTEVPMIMPPVPWTSLNTGGYLAAKTNLIRLPLQAVQQWERLTQSPKSQIYPLFDSLNQLASIPWKVNKPILDTVINLFNEGGYSILDIPEPPSACPTLDPITPDMTKVERFQLYRQRMVMRRRKAEMYSLWCDTLYRLSLANHFRDRIFWLPHNMDFRGRVYPCPPHLNHLGSDMARSLLAFAKGERLGPEGLTWLKIHLVNLTGTKKRESIDDRVKFADKMLPEILDSANNPLDGRRWWMNSEEPWQTLACCMEIRDALAHPGGPESFNSHFPVHQDGSCNGLQHYAALGRDSAGAASVNLAPSPVPQDVYSCVAAIVERERNNDAKDGVKVAQVLEGFVRRKVIKQTVMTTVYGVTRFGARLQIAKQLKDIDEFPKEFVWPASTYLVAKTFASLREMFTSTREIQNWFTESARMISQVCGQNVEYVTPLGLPVVQPYYRFHKINENKSTLLSGNVNEHYTMDMYERPNVMKQKNAFPPNFIHSLDSTHMMLTSLHCEQAGITFVSVHDCYWTHPCSIHLMNRICREQFVALHSQPILKDLSEFMLLKYGYSEERLESDPETVASAKLRLNALLCQLPARGDFDLKNVLKSVYFFS